MTLAPIGQGTHAPIKQIGIRQRSLRRQCRFGRATELVYVLATGIVLSLGGQAQAQVADWTGNSSSNYHSAANWAGNFLPPLFFSVRINPSANQPVVETALEQDQIEITSGAVLSLRSGDSRIRNLLGSGELNIAGPVTAFASGGEFSGNLTGLGTFTKAGQGTLVLSGASTHTGLMQVQQGTLSITGSTMSSALSVSFGTLVLGAGAVRPEASISTTWSDVVVRLNGANTIARFGGYQGSTLDLNGHALTISPTDQNASTINSIITGGTGSALTRSGTAAPVILGGANTYSGVTTVQQNALTVQNSSALGATGADNHTVVEAGAQLLVRGGITLAEDITLSGAGPSAGGALRMERSSSSTGANNTVSGAITLAGDTTITSDGVDAFGAAGSQPDRFILSGPITAINSGTTLTIAGRSATELSGTTSLANGILTKTGAGTLTISGTANPATLNIQGGAVALNNANALAATSVVNMTAAGTSLNLGTSLALGTINATNGGIQLQNGSVLTIGGADTSTILARITEQGGSGRLVKNDAGTLVLADAFLNSQSRNINTFSGGTTVNSGTLQLGTSQLSGFSIGSGGILNNAALVFANAGNQQMSNDITGSGTVARTGFGTVVLTGANSYTGETTISQGVLVAANSTALGTTAAGTTVSGTGQLGLSGGVTIGEAVTLNPTNSSVWALFNQDENNRLTGTVALSADTAIGSIAGRLTLSGVISGTAGITKSGDGELSLDAANTFTGVTTVAAGTLTLANTNAIQNSSNLRVEAGATVNVAARGFPTSVRSLTGIGTGAITLDSATMLRLTGNEDSVFAGNISSVSAGSGALAGSLSKLGTGNLTLTGVSTMRGLIEATAGTITLAQGARIGAGVIIMGRDGTFVTHGGALTGTPRISMERAGAVVFNGSETITSIPGTGRGSNTPAAGTITLNGTTTTLTLSGSTVSNTLFGGVIAGAGGLTVSGGAHNLSGANIYAGATTITGGTLTVGLGGTTGNLGTGDVTNNGTLVLNRSDNVTLANAISGTGAVTQAGTGTTVLTAANSYAGATTISAGTLQMGTGGTAGSIGTGAVVNNGTLRVNRSDAVTIPGAMSGTGTLVQAGTGTTILTGDSTAFAGTTQVDAGILRVNGTLGGAVAVNTGATLQGTGTIGGNVAVNGGATLAAGASPGTLSVNGNLVLAAGSTTQFEFGTPNVAGGATNDLVNVGGNLTLGGTLSVSPTPLANGYYRLFNVAGTVSGSFANQIQGANLLTGSPNQVNLLVGTAPTNLTWAGSGQGNNSGTWNATNTNWASGDFGATWASAGAVFGGKSAGTVTIEGAQSFQDITFNTAGYVLNGPGTLVSPTAGGFSNIAANQNATINAAITGAGGINKTGSAVLTLGTANTFTGATTVAAGTLSVTNGDALKTSSGVTVADGATLNIGASNTFVKTLTGIGAGAITLNENSLNLTGDQDSTFAGNISGSQLFGSLANAGTGNLTLTGTSTLRGVLLPTLGTVTLTQGASIAVGSIVMGANGTLVTNGGALTGTPTLFMPQGGTVTINGSETISTIRGGVHPPTPGLGTINLNGATTALTLSGTGTSFAGVMAGDGGLTVSGGEHNLSGANTYSGATTITGGTLTVGLGGTTGNLGTGAVNFTSRGALVLNRSDAVTLANTLTGAGALTKTGAGTATLSGTSADFAGVTNVNAGALRVTGTLGNAASSVNVNSGGTLQGNGTIGGTVTVNAGGALDIAAADSMTIGGNLVLNTGARTALSLGTAGTTARVTVKGGLTIGGTLDLGQTPLTAGYYRLFDVGGAITGAFGPVKGASLLTDVAGQLNLRVGPVANPLSWDGAGPFGDGTVQGGTGIWNATTANWAVGTGGFNDVWDGGTAVFGGSSGTVTVAGAQSFQQLTFNTAGYVLDGTGTLVSPTARGFSIIEANAAATINTAIVGDGGINKTGKGSLTLAGANSFAGPLDVQAGELRVTGGAAVTDTALVTVAEGAQFTLLQSETVGNITGAGMIRIENGSTLTVGDSRTRTFGGTIVEANGAANLIKQGTGTLILTSDPTITGAIRIDAGQLRVGAGGTSGALGSGSVVNNAEIVFDRSDEQRVDNAISGTGTMTQVGSGTTELTGQNTHTGDTTITNGTLLVSGRIANSNVIVSGNGRLRIGNSNAIGGTIRTTGSTISFANGVVQAAPITIASPTTRLEVLTGEAAEQSGIISSTVPAFGFEKIGGGALTLSGANTYGGVTRVTEGTLRLFGRINAGGGLQNNATFSMGNAQAADVVTVNGNLSGTGTLVFDADLAARMADRLVVTGDVVAGTAQTLVVNNVGGPATGGTITLVEVAGTNAGTFTLAGGTIQSGMYQYALGGTRNVELIATFNSVAAVYEVAPIAIANAFARLSSLEQRLGQRVIAPGADANGTHVWMNVTAKSSADAPKNGTFGARQTSETWGLQIGADFAPVDLGGQDWVLGVHASYDRLSTEVSSLVGQGVIAGDAGTIGASALWTGHGGTYVDLQGQASRINARFGTAQRGTVSRVSNWSAYAVSAEIGHRVALSDTATLTPQIQLSYARLGAVRFADESGHQVEIRAHDRVTARLGATYDITFDGGAVGGSHAFASTNLLHDFASETQVSTAGRNLTSSPAPTRIEFGLGGELRLGEGSTLTGRVNYEHGFGGGNSSAVSGNIGLEVKW